MTADPQGKATEELIATARRLKEFPGYLHQPERVKFFDDVVAELSRRDQQPTAVQAVLSRIERELRRADNNGGGLAAYQVSEMHDWAVNAFKPAATGEKLVRVKCTKCDGQPAGPEVHNLFMCAKCDGKGYVLQAAPAATGAAVCGTQIDQGQHSLPCALAKDHAGPHQECSTCGGLKRVPSTMRDATYPHKSCPDCPAVPERAGGEVWSETAALLRHTLDHNDRTANDVLVSVELVTRAMNELRALSAAEKPAAGERAQLIEELEGIIFACGHERTLKPVIELLRAPASPADVRADAYQDGYRQAMKDNAKLASPEARTLTEAQREAIRELAQTLLEMQHINEVGERWFTRGDEGMRKQFWMWIQRGQAAMSKLDVATLRSLLSPPPYEGSEAGRWQPIETAPRDGTRIILGWPGGGVRYAYWLDNAPTWSGWKVPSLELSLPNAPPTNWQPMPSPPPYQPDVAGGGK